jgi:arsenate reductase
VHPVARSQLAIRLAGTAPGNGRQRACRRHLIFVCESSRGRTANVRSYCVLFLCTGNSARSILAEVLLNHWGRGRFRAFSAGSYPKGVVHPLTLKLLRSLGLPSRGLRSKNWSEFARPGAPVMDLVVTVCDQAAGEVCPLWPGGPVTAHWDMADPAAVKGTETERLAAFQTAFHDLSARIRLLISLPVERLDRSALEREAKRINRRCPATGKPS